ncbi:unnamed protein product [Musa acuminata subsp. malaccensis]|uniref:(wild Malaysian banana) hypothetical protein n=1 Tax=Musa acuminata subsp. malaccensis TaxID=214687 RepID=A0A804JZS3_MUSAM|nr:unnamed protein product [Musa acuminata subsp. malaccensis]
MPRIWIGKEDIKAITKASCSISLKLLSIMIAIHLDDKAYICIESTSWLNNIENLYIKIIMQTVLSKTSSLAFESTTFLPYSSSFISILFTVSWSRSNVERVETNPEMAELEANKRNNMLPSLWAIAVILVLGFNEFIILLR